MFDDYFLQIKGNIEEKFKQKDNWDLRITSHEFINRSTGQTRQIHDGMLMELNALNNSLMDTLEQIVESNNQKYPR